MYDRMIDYSCSKETGHDERRKKENHEAEKPSVKYVCGGGDGGCEQVNYVG
jgi:hypothetical protein